MILPNRFNRHKPDQNWYNGSISGYFSFIQLPTILSYQLFSLVFDSLNVCFLVSLYLNHVCFLWTFALFSMVMSERQHWTLYAFAFASYHNSQSIWRWEQKRKNGTSADFFPVMYLYCFTLDYNHLHFYMNRSGDCIAENCIMYSIYNFFCIRPTFSVRLVFTDILCYLPWLAVDLWI